MNFDREVVITGMGVVTPIGIGLPRFRAALMNGESGIGIRSDLPENELPIRIAGMITDFDPKEYVKPRKAIKIMCEPIQFACAATTLAMDQAGLNSENVDPLRLGVVFGAEPFYSDPLEVSQAFRDCITANKFHYDRWDVEAIRKIQPLWMLKYLPNMAASHISIAIDAQGHSNTICNRDASGTLSLIEAITVIQRGWCDAIVAGGTGSLSKLTSVLYRHGQRMSQRFDEPESASRPFEASRDGEVPSEGAGALVIESAEHAERRGATPLARIRGWSQTFQNPDDADFFQHVADNYRQAVKSAALEIGDIAAVNANALGLVEGDIVEAKAIETVFGQTPVVANKGNFGNLGPGTSIVELASLVCSLNEKKIPGTRNLDHLDSRCPINASSKPCPIPSGSTMLKSTLSRQGQIASVILSAP